VKDPAEGERRHTGRIDPISRHESADDANDRLEDLIRVLLHVALTPVEPCVPFGVDIEAPRARSALKGPGPWRDHGPG
jgi:hypothetical protein